MVNKVPTISQIIAAINPDLYYRLSDDKEKAKKELAKFKKLIQEKGSYNAVKDKLEKGEEVEPKPLASHTLVYDSSSETLEPIYFFILDLMNDMGLAPKKYVDNFSSSPGSGHFAELGQRASLMQQQASKLLGDVNTVLKSILNVIYDLKEFRIRLQAYKDLKSKEKKDAAILSLKQIWMDKVDVMKGNSSIKAMSLTQAGFSTLIDAFLAAKDEKDVDRLDLNDRVKRILLPRLHEFNVWLSESGKELEERYELEKTYLKSQVNSLKLYSRWAKPYLKAAYELESKDMGMEAALVKTFNTIILELTLLGKRKIDVKEAAIAGDLSRDLSKIAMKRNYYSCVLVDFRFRGIPRRVIQQSHYAFGGRAEVTFKAYALNDDELKMLDAEVKKSEIGDALSLVEGATSESLGQLQEEIDFFLGDQEEEEEKKPRDTSNPFFALIGKYNTAEKAKEKVSKVLVVPHDNWIERTQIRPLAADGAIDSAFNLFDVYKKAHGMPSYT